MTVSSNVKLIEHQSVKDNVDHGKCSDTTRVNMEPGQLTSSTIHSNFKSHCQILQFLKTGGSGRFQVLVKNDMDLGSLLA